MVGMIGFLTGIVGGEMVLEGFWLRILAVLIFAVWAMWKMKIDGRTVLFGVVMFGFGLVRLVTSLEIPDNHISRSLGEVDFEGCIVEEPDVRSDHVKYTVEIEGEVSGRVLLRSVRWPVYRFGDCLEVRGVQELPESFEDFAYDKYLARYDLYSLIKRPNLQLVGEEVSFFTPIFQLKVWFEGRLNRLFGEPYSSFMAGLLLGSRRGIPPDLMDDFNETGLTHIIAISGYNITLLIVIVGAVLGFLGRRHKVVVASVVIFLFVILVGASAAVVRAAIMGCLSLLALYFGRQYYVLLALVAAAVLMGMWNPKIIVYDVGFQLSFLATLGLVLFAEDLEKVFAWLPSGFAVKESILMTFAAQILALPIILTNFERLSLVSPLANVFVLPFLPLAMMFGFLAVWFGKIFAFFGYLILELVINIVEFFASFGWASVEVTGVGFWLCLFYYWFICWLKFRKSISC